MVNNPTHTRGNTKSSFTYDLGLNPIGEGFEHGNAFL